MKKLWCLFVICVATVSLASTYELKKAPQSLEDWTNGEFYNGEAPPADATAEVFLPENTTSKVDNASIAYVGSFRVIRPRGMAALLVDVSTNAVFHAAFTPSVKTRPNERGLFIKRGVGFLQLASLGNVPRWNGDNQLLEHQFDYDSNFRVEAGVLKMPNRGLGATGKIITDFFLNDITVLKGGVFAPSASEAEAAATTWLNAIRGDGSISNNVGKGDHCVFRPRYSGVEPCVFSGSIDGKMLFYTSAHLHLTGTESTLESGGFRITENTDTWNKGILGVSKIGKNSQEASSLGKYSYVSLGEMGSRLLYLGSGEQTGKFFYFFETAAGKRYPSIIDAGAAGGITFTGNWLSNTGDGYICRLHLDGSNTVPCVVESAAPAGTGAAGGKLLYVVKKGSGTWRFTGNADRSAFSGWAIENGVLSFDSLKERGVNCSLGACSRFYEDSWGLVSNFTEAPYCFRLGAQNSCGTMQYIGSSLLFCSTRPMVLGGDGRLENAGESRSIFQSGISALSAGVKQLILSGENENENIITDITDGEGSVKVVKTGSGTWTLSGTNNVFTGGIEVRGGKLVLQGVSGRFKWWRLTIRELWGNINEIQMHELGLYDKDGKRVNGGLVRDDELTGLSASSTYNARNLRRLLPGKVAYGRELERRMNGSGERVLDELFNDADLSGGGFGIQFKTEGFSDWIYPKENNPETWLPIVMRHNDSANEVKSYDLSIRHAPNWGRMPRSWILEGSVDGETWWTVDDVSCADNTSRPAQDDDHSYWWWYANSSCAVGTASTHNAGKPISGSTNLTAIAYNCPVSVAAGATLEADGLVELSSLRINPSSAGTIKGVAFAKQGSVEITERLRGSTKLALNFVDCGATERLKQWKVTVKGSSGEWLARVVDGKIVVSPRIFAIVVR